VLNTGGSVPVAYGFSTTISPYDAGWHRITGLVGDVDATGGAGISDWEDVVGHHAVMREHTERHVADLSEGVRVDEPGARARSAA
jgi:hypothetical protein